MARKTLLRPSNLLFIIVLACICFLYIATSWQNSDGNKNPFFTVLRQKSNNISVTIIESSSESGIKNTGVSENSIFTTGINYSLKSSVPTLPLAVDSHSNTSSPSNSNTTFQLENLINLFNDFGKVKWQINSGSVSHPFLDSNGSATGSSAYYSLLEKLKRMRSTEEYGRLKIDEDLTKRLSGLTNKYETILQQRLEKLQFRFPQSIIGGEKIQINLAAVACGSRRKEAIVMLKSAILFSHEATLHVIMFSDKVAILNVAADLLELKWTVNALGRDLTFELHLDWFPPSQVNLWKQMYTQCATQRLFFPSLLPHIDSVMYLDTDIIIVSNLTDFWLHISNNMKEDKMAGMAANNEPTARGWYNTMSKIPYYGLRGLNAGVMLMNLTQMRNFSMEERSMATLTVYKEKIKLADQDILNIIFHGYPEKLFALDCSYNFNWVHCGIPVIYPCINKTTGESECFCNSVKSSGVKVVHGNSGTFHNKNYYQFMIQLYESFEHFDLLQDSPTQLIQNLKANFDKMNDTLCRPLTSEMLYKNALAYLEKISLPNVPSSSSSSSLFKLNLIKPDDSLKALE